ncbi:MAG: succinylglutamate desuccinylase/aspartoacylase family protein [Saprospiraceae bacterium]|nr:succinylglutamate desuccinylase/aspartoacylase family protein [Saprospiraceae bacterium]
MSSFGQVNSDIPVIDTIDLEAVGPGQIKHFWLKIMDNGMGQPILVPLIIARGKTKGPVLGLTAALHGNELNGIKIIQGAFEQLDMKTFSGTLVGIPGLNAISIPMHTRRFFDEEDLNRNFPGKVNGNRSQQYVWQINQKILPKLDYMIDMHTASFGRVNSLYVRADMEDEKMAKMALIQNCDIVLNNKGIPSADERIAATRTMRAEAVLKGIPTITIEYGNPQVYQEDMIKRGETGVKNVMSWLRMIPDRIIATPKPVVCKKSYWVFIDQGGFLEVPVELGQKVTKGELIGVLRNPFGEVLKNYYCPEDGVVIGKSSNPVNMSGGRIIHLGIVDENW